MILFASGCTRDAETFRADYIFENVNVIPMNEEIVLEKRTVAVRDSMIIAIIDPSPAAEKINIISGKRIDATGQYLMPGLADMHIHLHLESNVNILQTLMVELHEAGVPLLLGTDSFGTLVPGFSVYRELELMVESGLSPYEALRTGTVNVSSYLGKTEIEGTIAAGKRADFILLEDNPLDDIRHARDVHGVFTQGNWYSKSVLEGMLEEVKTISNTSD